MGKISQYPQVQNLDSNAIVPVVQGGETKKATVAQIAALAGGGTGGAGSTIQVPCDSALTNADAGRLMVWDGLKAVKSSRTGALPGSIFDVEFIVQNVFIPPTPTEWEIQFYGIPNDGDRIDFKENGNVHTTIYAKTVATQINEFQIESTLVDTINNLNTCLTNIANQTGAIISIARIPEHNSSYSSVFFKCDKSMSHIGSLANNSSVVFDIAYMSYCNAYIWLTGADNSYNSNMMYQSFLRIESYYQNQSAILLANVAGIFDIDENDGLGVELNGYRFPTTMAEYGELIANAIELAIAPHNTPNPRFVVVINSSTNIRLYATAPPFYNPVTDIYTWYLPNVSYSIASFGEASTPPLCYMPVLGLLMSASAGMAVIDINMVYKDFIIEAGARDINLTSPPPSNYIESVMRSALLPSDNGTLMPLSSLYDWENGQEQPQILFILSLTRVTFMTMQDSASSVSERIVKAMVNNQQYLGTN